MELAVRKWKVNFRGEVTVIDDTAVTDELMKAKHVVLWGDAESNKVIAILADRLPVKWAGGKVTIGPVSRDAATHAPILIYPNPVAPDRYVVLNSGYTFRQGSDVTNALQTPKLPDFALIDVTVPPSAQWPGKVTDAGFFDEGGACAKRTQGHLGKVTWGQGAKSRAGGPEDSMTRVAV